ncbi:MAG: GntR family transcriptional regulator [Pseudomonadota bacterium]
MARTGRKDEIRRRIRLKILLSDIAPGTVIDEEALADEFGVSRTPIREICAHLVAEGSAEYHRGRGACSPPVTAEGVEAVFEAAATAYPALFSLVVARVDAFDLTRLRSLVQALVALTDSGPIELKAGRYLDFMEACADTAQNEILARGTRQLIREECRIAIAVPQLQAAPDHPGHPLNVLIGFCGPLLAALERRDLDGVLTVLDDRLRRSKTHHDRLLQDVPRADEI